MSARRAVEVTCDGCDFTVPDYATAEQVRRHLRSLGWAVSRPGGRDYCPDCRDSSGDTSGPPASVVTVDLDGVDR